MISRIHQKLGTAGFVISIVALVAALCGGAYAAGGGLTGKQKKEVKKIAKQFAGKPGAPGATGPAGPKGDNGAQGAPGKEGPQGKEGAEGKQGIQGIQGIQGVPGQTGFTETLPSGKTETGVWALNVSARNFLEGASTSISFPIPLAQAGGANSAFAFTAEQTAKSEFGSSGCTGTVAHPTAPKGKLCVYTQEELLQSATPVMEARTADTQSNKYGVSGAVLDVVNLEGELESVAKYGGFGSWAVTAP